MLRPSKILSKGILSDRYVVRLSTLKFMDKLCSKNIQDKTFDTISNTDGFWDGRKPENINKIPNLDRMHRYLNSRSRKEKKLLLIDLDPKTEDPIY